VSGDGVYVHGVDGEWLVDCMLLLDMTVKSLVTCHMFHGATGVPRDCLLWQAARFEAGGSRCMLGLLVQFWLELLLGGG
jgi:hypothetical protein